MRWLGLLAVLVCAGCDNQKITHPFNPATTGSTGDDLDAGGDGGITFMVRDAGPDAGTGSTSGSTTEGGTGGSTGLSGTTGVTTGSSGSSGTSGEVDSGPVDAGFIDRDGDGLDDDVENALARAYLPFISVDSNDGCPLAAIVYRVHPHPSDSTYVQIIYEQLYEHDCGGFGQQRVGDTEVFALTVDPTLPAPEGANYLVAVSNQGMGCTSTTACTTRTPSGTCASVASCDLGMVQGTQRPMLYVSRGHHGGFTNTNACVQSCVQICSSASTPTLPHMINVGEPDGQLVHDLTDAGLVTYANGWLETSLLNYDPWGDAGFGGAGVVASDLEADGFTTLICP